MISMTIVLTVGIIEYSKTFYNIYNYFFYAYFELI